MSNYPSSAPGIAGQEKAIPIIILAAGSSSRLGQPKQLLLFGNETLLHRSVRKAMESLVGPVICVLGSNAEQVGAAIQDLPTHSFVHHNWQKGMGSSIKAGVQFVMRQFVDAPALIISVCDQAFLETHHFHELKAKFVSGISELVAACYKNGAGVPCLFSKKFFPDLMALGDEEGARSIMTTYTQETAFISFENGGVDIDTLTDWESVKNL
jgi:molybdenum cofactor cytidylyltransferase